MLTISHLHCQSLPPGCPGERESSRFSIPALDDVFLEYSDLKRFLLLSHTLALEILAHIFMDLIKCFISALDRRKLESRNHVLHPPHLPTLPAPAHYVHTLITQPQTQHLPTPPSPRTLYSHPHSPVLCSHIHTHFATIQNHFLQVIFPNMFSLEHFPVPVQTLSFNNYFSFNNFWKRISPRILFSGGKMLTALATGSCHF